MNSHSLKDISVRKTGKNSKDLWLKKINAFAHVGIVFSAIIVLMNQLDVKWEKILNQIKRSFKSEKFSEFK